MRRCDTTLHFCSSAAFSRMKEFFRQILAVGLACKRKLEARRSRSCVCRPTRRHGRRCHAGADPMFAQTSPPPPHVTPTTRPLCWQAPQQRPAVLARDPTPAACPWAAAAPRRTPALRTRSKPLPGSRFAARFPTPRHQDPPHPPPQQAAAGPLHPPRRCWGGSSPPRRRREPPSPSPPRRWRPQPWTGWASAAARREGEQPQGQQASGEPR